MTTQTVQLDLNVLSNLKQVNEDAKGLVKNLKEAQALASKLGGTAGSRAASKIAASSALGTDADTGLTRGTAAGGGRGTARDFARQAQGLGGLVHVYATFAANLFAVSAAFTALSKAADTTNMVKGLDQLGAASGKNLGSMAKNLTIITDGAISLRQAMEATAQASAAGLSGEQLERLTGVAKRASQALGRDMGDALNRLSRGVTKIEPELLDELGIMVKVDKAARDYALTLGKTATQLTEFEKRQSFAVAVIEQGEKKFNSIQLDANPYNKLLASFSNLAQKGGELLNTVLGPIAKILSESPMALSAVMFGLTAMLTSKAIPALSQWREELNKSAAVAAEVARKAALAHESFQANKQFMAGQAAAAPFERASLDALAGLQTSLAKALPKTSELIKKAVSDGFRVTDQDVTNYKGAYTRAIKKLEQLQTKEGLVGADDVQLQKEIALQKEKIGLLSQAVTLGKTSLENHKLQLATLEEANQNIENQVGWEEKLLKRRAEVLRQRAESSQILSNVGKNTQIMGMSEAWKRLREEVKYGTAAVHAYYEEGVQGMEKSRSGLNSMRAGFTLAAGGARILASGIMSAVGALSNVLITIGVITSAFTILDSLFSTNSKKAEEFSNALDNVETSVKGIKNTLDLIDTREPLEKFNAESINARAGALLEVSNGVKKLVKDFNELDTSWNLWTGSIDSIKSLWGGSAKQKFAESFANAVKSAISIAEPGPAKEAAIKQINKALNIDYTSIDPKKLSDSINKALLQDVTGGARAQTIEAVVTLQKQQSNSNADLQSGLESLTQATREYDTLIANLTSKDAFTKMAISSFTGMEKLRKSLLDSGNNTLATLSVIAEDVAKLKLFPDSAIDNIFKANKEVQSVNASIEQQKKLIEELKAKRESLKSSGAYIMKGQIQEAENNLKSLEKTLQDLGKSLSGIMSEALKEGAQEALKNFNQSLSIARQKAALSLSAEALKGIETPEAARLRTNIKMQEIDLNTKMLESQATLAIRQENLKLAIEENTLAQKQATAVALKKPTKEIDDALESLKTVKDAAKGVKTLQDIIANKANLETTGNIGLLSILQGFRESEIASGAQKRIVRAGGNIDEAKASAKVQLDALNIAQQSTEQKLKEVEYNIKLVGTYDEALQAQKTALELRLQEFKVAEQNIKREEALKVFEAQKSLASGKTLEAIRNAQGIYKENAEAQAQQLDAAQKLAVVQSKEQRIASYIDTADKLLKQEKERSDVVLERVNRLEKVGLLTESEALAQKQSIENALELKKQEIELDKLRKSRVAIGEMPEDVGRQAALANIDKQIAKQEELTGKINASTKANQEFAKSQADFNTLLAKLEPLTTSLGVVFGNLGATLGTSLKSMVEATKSYLSEQKKLEDTYRSERLSLEEEQVKTGKDIKDDLLNIDSKYAKKSADLEINKNLTLANSTKKLFAEKTTIYKLFDGIEKAMHVAKIGMMLAEVAGITMVTTAKTASVAPTVAAETAKSGPLATNALLNAMQLPPPASYVAYGITAAMIAAIFSAFGGGKTVPSGAGGFDSESYQKQQGTGGVLGDSTAKTESISKNIAYMKENSLKSINIENGMLKSLQSIDAGINKVTALVFSEPGITNPSATGPFSGFNTGTRDTSSQVVKLSDSMIGTVGISVLTKSLLGSTISTMGTYIGSSIGTALGSIIGTTGVSIIGGIATFGLSLLAGKLVGGLVSSIFGGKTSVSQSIVDSGLKLRLAVDDFGTSLAETVQYANVEIKKKKSGGIFRSSKTSYSYEEVTAPVQEETSRTISMIFKEMNQAIRGSVEALSIASSDAELQSILDKLKGFSSDLKISLKDMTGEQVSAALTTQLSSVFDDLSKRVFPWLTNFQKAGESLGDTLGRLSQNAFVLNNTFDSMGAALPTVKDIADSTLDIDNTIIANAQAAYEEVAKAYQDAGYYAAWNTELLERYTTASNNLAEAQKLVTDRTVIYAEQLVSFREYIIEGAGGLSAFQEAAAAYSDRFIPEAKRLQTYSGILSKALADIIPTSEVERFKELGIIAPTLTTTREEFSSLVTTVINSFKDTGTAGADLYNALVKIAPAFDVVVTAAEKLAELRLDWETKLGLLRGTLAQQEVAITEDLKDITDEYTRSLIQQYHELSRIMDLDKQRSAQEVKIYNLLGQSSEALAITRAQELESMDSVLRPTQRYIYALEDEANIKSKLNSTLKTTISNISTAINNLSTYRQQLLTGVLSNLNPAEKYMQTRQELDRLAAIAQSFATTSEEVAAKNDALSKIPAAGNAFLEASRGLFASSIAYDQDFRKVLDLVDATNTVLALQETDAQKQLSVLNLIEESTSSTAELLSKYLATVTELTAARLASAATGSVASGALVSSITTLPGFARGGIADGFAVVGEDGPEVVKFNNPARVFSNEQSRGMFNSASPEVVAELKALREEVAKLRADQHNQTGQTLQGMYDSTNRSAEKIVKATKDSSPDLTWITRSVPKIA